MKKKGYKILSFHGEGTILPHSLRDMHEALKELGHRVYIIDIPQIAKFGPRVIELAIMDTLLELEPDIVITIDTVGLLAQQYVLLNPQIKIISWFFDNPIPFLKQLEVSLIRSNYYVFCWDRAYEQEVLKEASHFYHLPFGTNPAVYKKLVTPMKYKVSFVGTWSEKRQKILAELGRKGIEIDLFGDKKWAESPMKNINFHGFADNYTECPVIYNQSKINLNISNEQLKTSLPVRIFDVASCGAFLLCDEQQDVELFGGALKTYTDTDDLFAKIHYWLDHDDERENVAEELFTQVRQDYTFEKRLTKLFNALEEVDELAPARQPTVNELCEFVWDFFVSLVTFQRYDEARELVSEALLVNSSHLNLRLAYIICSDLLKVPNQGEGVLKKTPQVRDMYMKIKGLLEDPQQLRAVLCSESPQCFSTEGRVIGGLAERLF